MSDPNGRTVARGHLLVVIGPSGSGKGTVLKEVFARQERMFYSVSATTRAPREGERHGEQYYFVTHEEFQTMIAQDGLLEYANYVGNFYGTPRGPVMERLEAGDNVILEIEIQGARQVKQRFPEAVLLFILPPSLPELRRRLSGRGTESADVVRARLRKAVEEIPFAYECDYIVINDEVGRAAAEICAVIGSLSARQADMRPKIAQVLNTTISEEEE